MSQKPVYQHFQRNIAICYAYIGTGFHGLQLSRTEPAIENIVMDALLRTELLPAGSERNLGSIKWFSASRTDAGVHAAAQIMTVHLDIPEKTDVTTIVQALKKAIPPNSPVTFWATASVPQYFNPQKFASGRRYLFLVPLYAFSDQSKEHLQWVRTEIMPLFIGEKNFHNYTKNMDPRSKSALRTIRVFTFGDPFTVEGEKFVLFEIRGISFMINQIRKMIAAVISASHHILTPEKIQATFSEVKWALHKWPGDGLLLDKVEFEGYRRKNEGSITVKNDVEFTQCRGLIDDWEWRTLFPHVAKLIRDHDIIRRYLQSVILTFEPGPVAEVPWKNNQIPKLELGDTPPPREKKFCLVA